MNKKKLFAPVLVSAFILILIYLIKGIYPFGTRDVGYSDFYQSFVPFYCRIWDILHGKENIFFDWHASGGEQYITISAVMSTFSPLNLFLLLFKREDILCALSLFTALKLILMSLGFSFAEHKLCPELDTKAHTFFAVLYAFSTFALYYYTNLNWLDVCIIAPVILVCAKNTVDSGKVPAYSLLLALAFIVNYYIAALLAEWIFLLAGAYIIFVTPKGKKGTAVFRIGIATVFAICMALFVLVPVYTLLSSTSRLENNVSYRSALYSFASFTTKTTAVMLWHGLEFPIAVTLTYVLKRKFKINPFIYCTFIFLLISSICEATNCILSMLSYNHFPYRYGFIYSAVILLTGAYLYNKANVSERRSVKANALGSIVGSISIVITILIAFVINKQGAYYYKYGFVLLLIIISILLYIIPFNKKLKYGFGIANTVIFSFALIAPALIVPSEGIPAGKFGIYDRYLNENTNFEEIKDFEQKTIESYNTYYLQNKTGDPLHKLKTVDGTYDVNYAFQTGAYTFSGWTNTLGSNIQATLSAFGYSSFATRTCSTGGTAFSDAFLGYSFAASHRDIRGALYSSNKTNDDINIYDLNYKLNGVINTDILDIQGPKDEESTVDFTNRIYRTLTKLDKNILKEIAPKIKIDEEANQAYFDIQVKGSQNIYLDMKDFGSYLSAEVNGERIKVSGFINRKNESFPTVFNSRMLYLGSFKDETVYITLFGLDENFLNEISKIRLYEEDLDLLDAFLKSKSILPTKSKIVNNNLCIDIENAKDGYILLPISYNKGLKCTANGKSVTIMPTLNDTMCIIPTEERSSSFKIHYTPPVSYPCIAIGIAAFILLIMLHTKIADMELPKFLSFAGITLFILLYIAVITAIFIYPLIFTMFMK